MVPLSLSFSAVLLMGLAFGAGPCNISCLPYLGPVFLSGDGRGNFTRKVLPFSLGRLTSYSLLGAVAGGVGYAATQWFKGGAAGILLGLVTMLIGLLLIRRSRQPKKACHAPQTGVQRIEPRDLLQKRRSDAMPLGLFFMGMGMALNPCIPLGTVLTVAAAGAAWQDGLWLGFGFGLGAVAIPTLIFGVAVAHFGEQIRRHLLQWRERVEQLAGGLLMMLGAMTAMGWVTP